MYLPMPPSWPEVLSKIFKKESYFIDNDKLILKFMWRSKRPKTTNTILKKNELGRLMLPDFKTSCKVTIIKTMRYANCLMPMRYWHKTMRYWHKIK